MPSNASFTVTEIDKVSVTPFTKSFPSDKVEVTQFSLTHTYITYDGHTYLVVGSKSDTESAVSAALSTAGAQKNEEDGYPGLDNFRVQTIDDTGLVISTIQDLATVARARKIPDAPGTFALEANGGDDITVTLVAGTDTYVNASVTANAIVYPCLKTRSTGGQGILEAVVTPGQIVFTSIDSAGAAVNDDDSVWSVRVRF